MSVVKKYKVGGKVKVDELRSFLAKKLEETRFTAKALPIAREVASN